MSRRTNARTALPDRVTHALLTSSECSSKSDFSSPSLSHTHQFVLSVILKLTSVTSPSSTNCMLTTCCGTAFADDTLFSQGIEVSLQTRCWCCSTNEPPAAPRKGSRKLAIFILQTLISSDEFNVSDVKVVWYKNGTLKTTRRRNI